ncbi:MAG TPA: hypothetical protein VFM46_06050, partial [Pseudomonadales bacterium]|nr:hypothetical protein [Pseudomonadales bacterium]
MECPKCGYIRQATDLAPDWQCPSCKVAYVKARKAIKPATEPALTQAQTANTEEQAQADEELQYELQTLAASGQKIVIYSIILNFILRSAERGQAMPDLALTVLFFAVS